MCIHTYTKHTVRLTGQAVKNESNSLLHVPKQRVDESSLSSAVEQLRLENNALLAAPHTGLPQSALRISSISATSNPCMVKTISIPVYNVHHLPAVIYNC